MRMIRKQWSLLAFASVFAGCTLGPQYEQPSMDIPEQWHAALSTGMESCCSPTDFVWWRALNDPILDILIQAAADQNLDLGIAGLRILEARFELKGKKSELYPHVDASLTTGDLYYNNKRIAKDIFGCSGDHSIKRNIPFFEAGFDASWEIDLFGAGKHELNAAHARLESVEESFKDAWITLSAEVARRYIELRSLQQRRHILLQNIEAQKDSVHLTQELLRIGMIGSIGLLQADDQLNALVGQLPALDLAIEKTIYRLSVLLGEFPGQWHGKLMVPGNLPHLPCTQPLGIPSELLRRRPDIRKAERELAAATELVGAAIASLFPRLTIYGFIGDISTQLKSFASGSGFVGFAAPQLLLPLFNSKMLRQDVALNKIRVQEALFHYEQKVLKALEEVEVSMASYRYEWERRVILQRAVEKNQEAYNLTKDLYERGVKDYIEVLLTHRALLSAQDQLVQSEAELLIHYISLYKALGGAWDLAICQNE